MSTASATSEERITESECHHHWVIEYPRGEMSKGVCKLCAAEKWFQNWLPETRREEDISSLSEAFHPSALEPREELDAA